MNAENPFKFLRKQTIHALNIVISEYEHQQLKCKHYHLKCDAEENVFLVAFKTVPMDSTGVAHILEHTSLCGSKKYPVRDPFFMMTRRSLNSFMNAFTASDWTAYPFATSNLKDFDNLRSVYLDAVFQSRLDPLDFAQEGHRIELTEDDTGKETAVFKGVVYNEMKGAMSSPVSVLYQSFLKYLFPSQTYHHNSGGEPDHIPDLTYETLIDFYHTHYHPSNATFFTYGNIDAETHQNNFQKEALAAFEPAKPDTLSKPIQVKNEKRYLAPVRIQEAYASTDLDPSKNDRSTYVLLAWLMPTHQNFEQLLEYHFLSEILLGHSASPLLKALETSSLGDAPAPLLGLHDDFKEAVFACGLQGATTDDSPAIETLVLDTLTDIAKTGIPEENIQATLHQIELSQREITGDHHPFGLEIIFEALSPALHGFDPFEFLEIDAALAQLKQKAESKDFIPNLINKCLIDNPHRISLTLYPESELNNRKVEAEKACLQKIYSSLTDSDKHQIRENTQALEARQAAEDNPDILPKVGINDIPPAIHIPKGTPFNDPTSNTKLTAYRAGTNGILIQKIIAPLPALDPIEIAHLKLLWSVWTNVGTRNESYLDSQERINLYTGGLNSGSTLSSNKNNLDQFTGFVTLSTKGLKRNRTAMNDLLSDYWHEPNLSETQRIRDLLHRLRQSKVNGVTNQGHVLAMQAASNHFYPIKSFNYISEGLPFIKRLKQLGDTLNSDDTIEQICAHLKAIHKKISQSPRQQLLITDEPLEHLDLSQIYQAWSHKGADSALPENPSSSSNHALSNNYAFNHQSKRENIAWLTASQVNFCAKSYPTVAQSHTDIAPLRVLSAVLRNNFLHTEIREKGGAYGGGATLNSTNGGFSFYSYRDPRLKETLEDFDRAIEWILNEPVEDSKLEEAILGIVSGIDKPLSPAGEATSAFYDNLFQRTPDEIQCWRQSVIDVSKADLLDVANKYLRPDAGTCAVITDPETWKRQKLKDFSEFEL